MPIEEIIKKLENRSYTTKELIELGISKHRINGLIEASILTRTSRGHYDCIIPMIEQCQEAKKFFSQFKNYVFKRHYEKAYEALLKNFETRTDFRYDHHLRIYFTILNQLTEETHDLSFLSELREEEFVPPEHSYNYLFDDFIGALHAGKIEQAYSNIKKYRERELEDLGIATLSTKLFHNLTLGLKIKESENRKNTNRVKEPSSFIPYSVLLEQLYYYLNNFDCEKLLEILEKIISRTKYPYVEHYIQMQRLLETYKRMEQTKEPLPVVSLAYPAGLDYFSIFSLALQQGDYKTALANVGKVIYLDPNNKDYQDFRILLFKICDLDKNYTKKEVEKEESATLESAPVSTPIERVKEPTREKEYITHISEKELYDLVYDGEHDKLYSLLESYFSNPNYERNRIYYILYRLLYFMKSLSEERRVANYRVELEASPADPFGYFFEAIRRKGFLRAIEVVEECMKRSKAKNPDDIEFELYMYMLQDVSKMVEKYEEDKELSFRIKSYDREIDNYIYQRGGYTEEQLKDYLRLLEEKRDYLLENYMDISEEEYHLISLLRVNLNFKGSFGIFDDFFDKKEYTGSLVEQFEASMSYGDYASSLNFIASPEWLSSTKDMPKKKYFEAYKKLLFALKGSVETKIVTRKEPEESVIISEEVAEKLEVLRKIRSLVKKRDYVSAFIETMDSGILEKVPELDFYLNVLLNLLVKFQLDESGELLEKYKSSFRSGDTKSATVYLNAYKEYISNTGLDRNLDYHYDRIHDLESRINEPNFVKLENLYDRADYFFEQKDYPTCITIINEYIELDKDRSPKGYFLRGRAYEYMRDYDSAKRDYEKAVSISPKPKIFFRLGKLSFYKNDYDNALKYYHQLETRNSLLSKASVDAISSVYRKIGNEEKANQYQKRYQFFHLNKK